MPLRSRSSQMMHSAKESYSDEGIRCSDASVLCQNQLVAITDRRVKSGKAHSLAKTLNWTHEKNLQEKRERLRVLLATEASLYQQELINDNRTKAEENFQSRENRMLALRAERERQRLKFVEEMRVQQLINSCDEIRPFLRQKLQDECKNCQQLQIDDNNLKKLEELDQQRLWHDVQNQVFNQMTQRELDESLIAHNRNLKDQQILRKQMLEKNEIHKQIEHEEDTMHCGKIFGSEPSEQELLIQNKKKQFRFAQDLLSQQAEKRLAKETQRHREILHELASIDITQKEMKLAERNARMGKKQNLKETLHFLGYTKNVDREKSALERENDISTENIRNEKANEYLKNRNYFIQQRDEFNKSIHEERWKQIMDRKQKMAQEKNQKINEIIEARAIFSNVAREERELLTKKKNSRLQYGHELRAQCRYEKLEKEKATISSKKLTETFRNEETQKIESINNNFGRIHEIYPVHPNYKAIFNAKN